MTRGQNDEKLTSIHGEGVGGTVLLAFDSACMHGAGIAEQISGISDGEVSTIPLSHPQVEYWLRFQKRALKSDRPTLFVRAAGDGPPTAYQGLQIARILTTTLGVKKAWEIARLVGEETSPSPAFQDRRQFLQGALGVTAAAALLMGRGKVARASGASDSEAWQIIELTGKPLARTKGFWHQTAIPLVESAERRGYNQTGSVAFLEVSKGGEMVRNVAYLPMQRRGHDLQVWLSLERGDLPLTHIVAYANGSHPSLIEVGFDDEWMEVDAYQKMAQTVEPQGWPSRCSICRIACGFAASPTPAGLAGCISSCTAASGGIGAPICAAACGALVAAGVWWINDVGCPSACDTLGFC